MIYYPSYKPTSIPWLPSMPANWNLVKAKFLFNERVQKGYEDEPLLAATQLHGVIPKSLYENTTVTAQKDFHLLKLVEVGDFVISLRSFQGGIEYAYYKGIISPAYTIFYHKDKEQINGQYFKYFFKSQPFVDSLKLFVTGIREGQNIDYSEFKDSLLPLPSYDEQTAIANYLDAQSEKIETFISKKQKLIELLKEQKQAIINKAVTKGINNNAKLKPSGVEWLGDIPEHWVLKKLKYFGSTIIGVTYSPNDIVDEGLLVLRSSNIQDNKISFVDCVRINKSVPQKLITRIGDILICARNGSADLVGKNICIDENSAGNTFGAFMSIFRTKYWRYFSYFFNSSIFKAQTGLFSTSTINQLTSYTLNNLMVAFPTDEEERKCIIEFINIEMEKIDSLILRTQKEIELIKEYKQSLIAEVVTGKIKVL